MGWYVSEHYPAVDAADLAAKYIYLNLPASIYDPAPLWADYPHIPIAAPVKFYYLLQTAFYIHQVLILNAEERRKDHIQMMTHHVITIALVGASYYANFTRVGCMLLALMDWCDIWLPVSSLHAHTRFCLIMMSSWPKCCAISTIRRSAT